MNLPEQMLERHLCRLAEHCVSVIALCRRSGSKQAELAYETYLANINLQLRNLRSRPHHDPTIPSTDTQATR